MNLKTATLIAVIGIAFETLFVILLNIGVLRWSVSYNLISIIIGNGALSLFLIVLYLKQK